jgi:hypothetical protein
VGCGKRCAFDEFTTRFDKKEIQDGWVGDVNIFSIFKISRGGHENKGARAGYLVMPGYPVTNLCYQFNIKQY